MHKWLVTFVYTKENLLIPGFSWLTLKTEADLPSMEEILDALDGAREIDIYEGARMAVISVSEIRNKDDERGGIRI